MLAACFAAHEHRHQVPHHHKLPGVLRVERARAAHDVEPDPRWLEEDPWWPHRLRVQALVGTHLGLLRCTCDAPAGRHRGPKHSMWRVQLLFHDDALSLSLSLSLFLFLSPCAATKLTSL